MKFETAPEEDGIDRVVPEIVPVNDQPELGEIKPNIADINGSLENINIEDRAEQIRQDEIAEIQNRTEPH